MNQMHVLGNVVVLLLLRLRVSLEEGLCLCLVLEVSLGLGLWLIEGLWCRLQELLRLLLVALWLLGIVCLVFAGYVSFLGLELWLLVQLQLLMLTLSRAPVVQRDSTFFQIPVLFLLSFYASLTRSDVLIRCCRFASAIGGSKCHQQG